MDRDYWNALASDFEDKVLEIAKADSDGTLASIAAAAGDDTKVAIDFGCGIGSSTRLIAPWFGRTIGIDFSPKLIDRAKRLSRDTRIEFRCRDLSRRRRLSPRADVAFAVNVLIADDPDTRRAILANIVGNTARRGTVVLVVPALESVLHVYHCLIRTGKPRRRKRAIADMDRTIGEEVVSLADGIVKVGDQPTKHYTAGELDLMARSRKLDVDGVHKVRYPWREETDNPELLDRFPRPWDWALVATRS